MQLSKGYKGFSFSKEGPLDMRMDPTSELTAHEIVNKWPEKNLGLIFRDLGEEPKWRQAARAIVQARRQKKIESTKQLADLIVAAIGIRPAKKKLHPATLIFQGLRICVNRELESLQMGLAKAMNWLAPGGRLGVISFHRLEDRIVKNIFRDASAKVKKHVPIMRLLTKKPLAPSTGEIRLNPRARSAKMRFIEKV